MRRRRREMVTKKNLKQKLATTEHLKTSSNQAGCRCLAAKAFQVCDHHWKIHLLVVTAIYRQQTDHRKVSVILFSAEEHKKERWDFLGEKGICFVLFRWGKCKYYLKWNRVKLQSLDYEWLVMMPSVCWGNQPPSQSRGRSITLALHTRQGQTLPGDKDCPLTRLSCHYVPVSHKEGLIEKYY